MRRARRRLSDRMLRLTMWYANGAKPRLGRTAMERYQEMWDAVLEFHAAGPATTHGPSRRDGTGS